MDLDAVVSVLVAVFAAEAFSHGGEGVGQAVVLLAFLAFLRGEGAFAGDVFEGFVEVDVAGAFVEQSAGSVEFGLDYGDHFSHSGEFDDGFAELATVLGVSEGFAVSDFGAANALSGDAEAGAVHQGHYVFDKTHTAGAAEFGGSVLVNEFASGRAFDTHLVFDAAHGNATVALVVDEHRQAAAVFGAFFRAGEHQVDVAVAVGDEALNAVKHPGAVLFLGGAEHHGLEVGTGVGFGEVHRHGFAFAHAGDEAGALVFVTEFVEGFGAVLEAPEVFEAGIGARHDVGGHDVGCDGEVQTTEAAGHSHTHEAGLTACF